ncbi:MAG: tRNA uridine-5-carboxymethylaminomethyl(34) synthesis GTPase MnmE [Rhodospirillales bacterium]
MTGPATIFALASGAGAAGVAVVRVSGPGAGAALVALTDRPLPRRRVATLRRLVDPASAETLDEALVLWMPGPASFTGEDVVELHIHGGRAVVAGVVDALGRRAGLRPAEPGEFTRRAFETGRMDLTAAEAVADLVAAETVAQRRQALRQMGGALARLYDGWRERLVRALAHVEAAIDFPDEDLPGGILGAATGEVAALEVAIGAHLDDGGRGERLRAGVSVAIVGAPNAGKSSLLNALAGRDVAIVSARAGTTRDVIEVHLDLAGCPVILADTAGQRETDDEIEAEGVRRARARAAAADLTVALFDATTAPDDATRALVGPETIVVRSKADLGAPLGGIGGLPVSARTGAGLAELLARLTMAVTDRFAAADQPALTRARHRSALIEARDALARSRSARLPELAAEDLRLAARALGRITGRIDVEDLLDVIFRDFCIGK